MLQPWCFSTSEQHPRGQERIAAVSLELEAASESPQPELCFRTTPAAFPKYPHWLPTTIRGGAQAGASYKKLFVRDNSKHIQSKQTCIMNPLVLIGHLPQLLTFTHSRNICPTPNLVMLLTCAFSLGRGSVSSEKERDLPKDTQPGSHRAGSIPLKDTSECQVLCWSPVNKTVPALVKVRI